MLKSLVVGVNGNEWSRVAAELAAGVAKVHGFGVHFLAILDIEGLTRGEPSGLMGSGFKQERDRKVVASMRERLEAGLEEARQLAEAAGITHRSSLVEGDPAEVLGKQVSTSDLLVIGRKNTPRTDREPPSSQTMTDILRHTHRPVLVVGPVVRVDGPVVIAYDGSTQSTHALESFAESGLYPNAPLHLVRVGNNQEEGRADLERAQGFLARHGRQAELHLLPVEGSIAKTLQAFVEKKAPALLVMGAYGEPRLKELILGSVSKELLGSVKAPLFVEH